MGTILPNRFDPIRLLRKDRVSATFVATDHRLGRNEVVVKVFGRAHVTRNISTTVDILSWYRGVRHSCLSEILDSGLTPRRDLFYVREYHTGSDFLTAANIDSAKALVSAVDFLHSKQRIHGSLKPTNVFASGRVLQLLDPWIGQSRSSGDYVLTEEDVRFTAPEVLGGAAVTAESDLYSVGALLYRFYSGRDPFEDSDLESLKSKYIWASPRPLTSVSHVSKTIGVVVTHLLSKDPNRRSAAFEALKEEMGIHPVTALRAPVIGFMPQIEGVLTSLTERRALRLIHLEGAAGSGKSRFAAELQCRASFEDCPVAFVATTPAEPYVNLTRSLVSVIDAQNLDVGTVSAARLRRFIAMEREPASKFEQDEIDRDLVSLFASIARQARTLVVIEDLDRSSRKLIGLLELIVQQLTELDLLIVVTSRPGGLPLQRTKILKDFLGANFQSLAMPSLNQLEAQALTSYFSSESDQCAIAELKGAGNPCFIEDYCRFPSQAIPQRVRNALSTTILKLPKRARHVAEVLSVFGSSGHWNALLKVAGMHESDLRECLECLERFGLADVSALVIRYPDARAILQSRIPSVRRTELHARVFRCLDEAGSDRGVLARHAFQGGLLDIAADRYRQLARERFAANDRAAAASYYGYVLECRTQDPEIPPLDPEDSLRLARSLAFLGDKASSRRILQELVDLRAVSENSELLASVYAVLASPLIEDSVGERIRFLKLAIGCLQGHSIQMVHSYRALIIAYLSAGKTAEAESSLRELESRCNSEEERQQLEDVRASVLMNQGNFKEAARCLMDRRFPWSTPGGVANNLAVCMEQLGDLRKARELQMSALQEADASGSLFVLIISLSNVGSMETKLGNLSLGEKYFNSALAKLKELQGKAGGLGTYSFGITYADAAVHYLQRGEYRKAQDCLGKINYECAGPTSLEILSIDIARCEFLLALGQLKRAVEVLDGTKRLAANGDFFEVERILVEAQLREPSYEFCKRLERILPTCRRLAALYQECRVLIVLAATLHSLGDLRQANDLARKARRIARANGYRLLATRALLLMGMSAEGTSERGFALKKSMDEAIEMRLTPLVAECAFRIGSWRLNCGDYTEARDYLFKSVSITARLAEDLTSANRKTYLSMPRHTQARNLLNEASEKARSFPRKVPEMLDKEGTFFVRLYRLAAAMTAAADMAAATSALLQALKQSVNHPTIVALGIGPKAAFHPLRASLSEEVKKQVLNVASVAGDKPYFTGIGTNRVRDTAVWVPMLSLSLRGGIYVECPRGQSALDEQEIEFLTIVAAIAGAAFDRVCVKTAAIAVSPSPALDGIVGTSGAIADVRARIEVAAQNAATVLIEGESGTGKELVAKAIHRRSNRAKAPFIPLDCGALPEGLIEAELFGAKKGAYTGAQADRSGLFEAADQGTIFLDEISNLGLAAQAKLLRVLQDREVRKIGSTTGKILDVRLIAATNCNLEKLVRDGKFRRDLLYRLKVLHILLPPLRDRRGDIPLLATTFLERLNAANQTTKHFGPRIMEKFLENDYPGNVRELQNTVERGFYSTSGAIITQVDFLQDNSVDRPEPEETETWFREITEGRQNFWLEVHDRYKRRDISREKVIALVDFGLRDTRGNYKMMASKFRIPKDEYRRFMDFLRRNRCLLDFRPYRRLGGSVD